MQWNAVVVKLKGVGSEEGTHSLSVANKCYWKNYIPMIVIKNHCFQCHASIHTCSPDLFSSLHKSVCFGISKETVRDNWKVVTHAVLM